MHHNWVISFLLGLRKKSELMDKHLNSAILLLYFDVTCGGELNIQKRGREHDFFFTWFNVIYP